MNTAKESLRKASPYNGVLTREQFLFFEMRTTAKLVAEGLSEDEIYMKIQEENLFQFPTEKSVKNITKACLERLKKLSDNSLIDEIAHGSQDTAKQICLYAMMKHYRLVQDFMLTVVGEKYRVQDLRFSKTDVNVFFMRLQEQDDWVATWSDKTIAKIKQVLIKMLVETEYLDGTKSEQLNPILISTVLENAIRANNDEIFLPVFNCFM
jgi:hypothetical protein